MKVLPELWTRSNGEPFAKRTLESSGNLKREREKRGMSQVGLAKAAGLNRTHVGYLESGKRSPVLNTIRLLAKALEIGGGALVDDYVDSGASSDHAT